MMLYTAVERCMFSSHRKGAHDFGRDLKDLASIKFDLGASILETISYTNTHSYM